MRTGLKICERIRLEISLVIRHAERHRHALGSAHSCFEGGGFTCAIVDYQVCFSIEQRPDGWARHIAIRDAGQGNIPHPNVVDDVLREFNFARSVAANLSWMSGSIVHVVEKLG